MTRRLLPSAALAAALATLAGGAWAQEVDLIYLVDNAPDQVAVAEALAALTRASHAAHEALPGTLPRTHGLGVHPRHDHQGRQVGHTAYQALQLRVGDPSAAGELVQRLGEAPQPTGRRS